MGKGGYGVGWIGRINERLSELSPVVSPCTLAKLTLEEHFTPYQLVLGTLTLVHALRHVGDVFGLQGVSNDRSVYQSS
jgi:hypothetical protein